MVGRSLSVWLWGSGEVVVTLRVGWLVLSFCSLLTLSEVCLFASRLSLILYQLALCLDRIVVNR